jgi:general secretion pathway protein J
LVSTRGACRTTGFTLLEVLVAMAVFAVLAGIAYGALVAALDAREGADDRNTRRAAVMRALTVLERDLLQMVRRPVWDEFAQMSPALVIERPPGARLELTRTGRPNPQQAKRSALQRVAYSVENEALVRRTWYVLDRTAQTVPAEETVLEDVEGIVFEALAGEWSTTWPEAAQDPGQMLTDMPRSVRFVITLPDIGEVARVVPGLGD